MPENQEFFRGLLTDETDLTDNTDIAEDGVRREIAETSPGNLPAPRVSAFSSVLSVRSVLSVNYAVTGENSKKNSFFLISGLKNGESRVNYLQRTR